MPLTAPRYNTTPAVTVIIPVRNRSSALVACLEAISKQTFPRNNFEILVVDNGSTEDIRAVCDQFHNVVYLQEKRIGSYCARNTGIAQAHGRILAFTDSDCLPDPTWISSGVNYIAEHDCHALAGSIKYAPLQRSLNVYEAFEQELFPLDIQDKHVRRGFGATANLFVKKSTFTQVGCFNEALKSNGDVEWGLRLVNSGLSIHYCESATIVHPRRSTRDAILLKIRRSAAGATQLTIEKNGCASALWMTLRDCPISPRILVFTFLLCGKYNLRYIECLKAVLYFSWKAAGTRMTTLLGREPFAGD